jgi:hypothetical protein
MISIKPPQQKNYELSKDRALSALSQYSTDELTRKTGGRESAGSIFFNFFRWEVSFNCSEKTLNLPPELQSKSTENLILHYIAYSKGIKPSGDWINFYQIRDATLYLPVFNKRTIGIIQKKIKTLDAFEVKCPLAGGMPIDFTASAKAFQFSAFPHVPLLLVFYEGDEDIPSELKFMFDASVVQNLPAEDIVVVAQFLSLQFLRV